MAKLIIFGTGDIAQLAHYYFDLDSEHEVVAFTVDQDYLKGDFFEQKPVIPFDRIKECYPPNQYKMFVALSYAKMNSIRESKYYEAKKMGYELVSYISSKCTYLSQFACGDNCFILEDNTIQPFVRIGSNVTLWSGNHIGHHSTLHNHNFISSHVVVSGHCEVLPNCFLGVNSTLHHNVRLNNKTLVAAGAIISKNTVEKGVYLPSDTRIINKESTEINL